MIRIKRYFRKGLPVDINEAFYSIDSFAEYIERIYHSHIESGSTAGMWVELASECSEELHVGVSDVGWALLYVLSMSPLICIGIQHSEEWKDTEVNFQYVGAIDVSGLHPKDEALRAIWKWGVTGRIELYMKECLRD